VNTEGKYLKVLDERGNPVVGLWERNGVFYGQFSFKERGCRRLRLDTLDGRPANTLDEACEAYHRIRAGRGRKEVQVERVPTLAKIAERYLAWIEEAEAKAENTLESERYRIAKWVEFFGGLSLNRITKATINDFVTRRKREGVSNATINLGVYALSNLFSFSKDTGIFTGRAPTEDWKSLPHLAVVRPLITTEQFNALVTELLKPIYPLGRQAADYVRLLAYSGARKESALFVEWSDVAFSRRQLFLRRNKGSKPAIVVDFNAALETHLQDMQTRRVGNCRWLFPSPRTDAEPVKNAFRHVIEDACAVIQLDFHLHDLRHFFASHSIMSGIDFKTTARWLGHADGGILAAQRYGHLTAEHTQQQAGKLNFGG
jgi:site-specific recombinase XerD